MRGLLGLVAGALLMRAISMSQTLPADFHIFPKDSFYYPANKDSSDLDVRLAKGQTIYTIYGYHESDDAVRLLDGLVPLVEKDPSDWIFVLENGPYEGYPEFLRSLEIAGQYDIPIKTFIPLPEDKETVEKAEAFGYSKDDIFTYFVVSRYSEILSRKFLYYLPAKMNLEIIYSEENKMNSRRLAITEVAF